jgi:hypothetical protein
MLRQVLQETGDIWQVESLLQRLKKTDEYFDYIILKSEACAPVGVVWMTKTMKGNWILYGNNLSLDIMKRELNELCWVYMGPVCFDQELRVVNVREALVLEESMDLYAAVMNALFEMEPLRTSDSINVIFGDCFLSNNLLPLIGLSKSETTKVIWDHFHLVKDVWPKYFGDNLFERLKEYLGDMIRATTQQKFDESVQHIIAVLRDDPEKLEYICGYFAAFVIDSIPGSLEWRGLQRSEANHAGVLATLGTGSLQKMVFQISQLLARTAG